MTDTEKFLQLIKDNPTLPIVPLVGSEIVADDGYNYWIASWGDSEVSEIISYKIYGNDTLVFKDDPDDLFEYLCGEEENENRSDDEIRDIVNGLNWKKVIVVYIEESSNDWMGE